MDKAFQRAQPHTAELLSALSSNRHSWKDCLAETKGGFDSQMGSYSHAHMRPDFNRGRGDKFDSKYAAKWRTSGFLGSNSWQMYKDALPQEWEKHAKDPLKGNDWMKLHEKNPLFLSRFMNAQGMPLSSRYSGLRSGAHSQLLVAIERSRHLGLLPVWGNPYYHRNIARKPTPRVSYSTKDQVEAYRAQWIENERVKEHFAQIKKVTKEIKALRNSSSGVETLGGLPHFPRFVDRRHIYDHRRFNHSLATVDPLDCI